METIYRIINKRTRKCYEFRFSALLSAMDAMNILKEWVPVEELEIIW